METDLADRYGTSRSGSRRAIVVATAIIVSASFLAWLAWATWFNVDADVRSELQGFEVVDKHTAEFRALVDITDGAEDVTCRARALSTDKAVVGDLQFTPEDGLNTQEITTEREATSVDWIGCTSKDQSRAQ